ncbi:MAG: molecular chaperone DnaJ, partial [Alistipes sp.]
YYEVLGVAKNANADEIKKAYRQAAIKFHPDKNPGDKQSEENFKEAAEAYDVLSNPDKRARYDRFGHAGMSGAAGGGGGQYGGFGGGGFSMDDIFSQFGDIFGGHFGGSYSSSGGGGRQVNRGSDIRVKVKMTLAEISNGVTKKLKINKNVACDKCGGSGAKDSNSYASCSTCNGAGYVSRVENTFFGPARTQRACPTCGGKGRIITAPCDKCHGEGAVNGAEVVEIQIPAGVGEGMVLTVSGRGNAARQGGTSGDLQVLIEEEHNPELVRDGNDLIHNLNITVVTALLGAAVEVPTVDGRAKIKIAPGTHAGKVLRLGGKGLPDVNGYGRGDELVVVDITIPAKLTSDERRMVEQLATQPNFQKAESVRNQNIFERMKGFFR